MANIEFPGNGFVESVEAGEEATIEPLKIDYNFLNTKFDSDELAGHTHDGTAGNAPKIGLAGLKQEVLNKMGGFPNCKSKGANISYTAAGTQYDDGRISYKIEIDGDAGQPIIISPDRGQYFEKEITDVSLCIKALTSIRIYVFHSNQLLLDRTGETYLFSLNFTAVKNTTDGDRIDLTATANYGIPFGI